MRIPSQILLTAKLLLGVSLLGFLVASMDFQQLLDIAHASKPGMIPLCIIITFLTYDFQVWLLGLAARPFAKIPHLQLFQFTMIGRFFSLFLPSAIGGDAIKGLYLLPYFDSPSKAFASIFMQRLLGGASTLLTALALASIYLPAHYRPLLILALAILLCGAILLAFLAFRGKADSSFGKILKGMLNSEFLTRLRLRRFLYALIEYRHSKSVLVQLFLLSFLSVVFAGVVYWVSAYTLSVPISYYQAFVAGSVVMISAFFPLTPGGLGVGEAAFVYAAGLVGVPPESAFATALFVRLLSYLCALPGGLLYLTTSFRKSNP